MQNFEKTKYQIDINEILEILKSIQWDFNEQLCVTSRDGNNLKDGSGSINSYTSKEHEFSKLNTCFLGSSIEKALYQLKNDGFSHGRVRVMSLQPKKTYSYHMDCEPRIHFALITTPESMIIIDDKVFRVPADGNGYLLNTTQYHTAINCAHTNRIHLVINRLIPVKKLTNSYLILNKNFTENEFNKWLLENKPPTANTREDYYFI